MSAKTTIPVVLIILMLSLQSFAVTISGKVTVEYASDYSGVLVNLQQVAPG